VERRGDILRILAVLLLALTIVIAFWDDHRLLAAGLVTGAFALIAIGAVLVVRARLQRRPQIPRGHAAEFKRDADAFGDEPS
jgi:uncharacterized membrane protein YqjE